MCSTNVQQPLSFKSTREQANEEKCDKNKLQKKIFILKRQLFVFSLEFLDLVRSKLECLNQPFQKINKMFKKKNTDREKSIKVLNKSS